ncbi:MAG: hypothetical protein V4619_18870 [Bacteroidota bacterium]
MTVAVNYWWVSMVVICALLLIIWLVKRNLKDKKELEDEIIKSELNPKKHDDQTDNTIRP